MTRRPKDIGILVVRHSRANVRAWWAIVPLDDLMALHDPSTPRAARVQRPVRMRLAELVTVLRTFGYGDPVDEEVA